ncbi:MAG: type transport system permease protein [Archaeoglobi archaeon]|nr:type transport system permease protein [Archaeoglobi archaeon]MDK2782095.1 type transport system permease protein [Archaeoglobi archaeon]
MKVLTIAKKDILMYYLKGPVVIFGILLPLFLFLAFWIGKDLPLNFLIAALVSMTVFFSSTSVSPVIAPWEGQMRTLERLFTCPVSVSTIILGDVIASMIFGVILSIIPVLLALILGVKINILLLLPSILIASFCFSCLGLLFSAYPTNMPSTIMMISSLIRFPLIFISGIFIPVEELPSMGKIISLLSPLTYFTDIARVSLGMNSFLPVYIDFLILLIFSAIFAISAVKLHERALLRRVAI